MQQPTFTSNILAETGEQKYTFQHTGRPVVTLKSFAQVARYNNHLLQNGNLTELLFTWKISRWVHTCGHGEVSPRRQICAPASTLQQTRSVVLTAFLHLQWRTNLVMQVLACAPDYSRIVLRAFPSSVLLPCIWSCQRNTDTRSCAGALTFHLIALLCLS